MKIGSYLKKNISKEGLKIALAVALGLIVLFYLAIISRQHKEMLLGAVIICPIVTFILLDDKKTIKQLQSLQSNATGICAFISFVMLCSFSHHETHWDKYFLKGKIYSHLEQVEDDRGRTGLVEEKDFTPYYDRDAYKVEIIKYSLLIILFGCPIACWKLVKRQIDKTKPST